MTPPRRAFAGRGIVQEVGYLHEDEARALADRAREECASKAEITRRPLRAYLWIKE